MTKTKKTNVKVKSYTRKDGTRVRSSQRSIETNTRIEFKRGKDKKKRKRRTRLIQGAILGTALAASAKTLYSNRNILNRKKSILKEYKSWVANDLRRSKSDIRHYIRNPKLKAEKKVDIKKYARKNANWDARIATVKTIEPLVYGSTLAAVLPSILDRNKNKSKKSKK